MSFIIGELLEFQRKLIFNTWKLNSKSFDRNLPKIEIKKKLTKEKNQISFKGCTPLKRREGIYQPIDLIAKVDACICSA